MVLFPNLGLNLHNRLFDVPMYVSAQLFDFFDLGQDPSFLIWKLVCAQVIFRNGH